MPSNQHSLIMHAGNQNSIRERNYFLSTGLKVALTQCGSQLSSWPIKTEQDSGHEGLEEGARGLSSSTARTQSSSVYNYLSTSAFTLRRTGTSNTRPFATVCKSCVRSVPHLRQRASGPLEAIRRRREDHPDTRIRRVQSAE